MKVAILIIILLIMTANTIAQDCDKKNQSAVKINTGNLDSLSRTFSVVFKDKAYNSLRYLIQVAGNAEIQDDTNQITQKEIQEILRYVYSEKLTYADLLKMRTDLVNHKDFQRLTPVQQEDAQRVLNDIIEVEKRMNEYRNLSNMYCRFALSDNPFDQFPNRSMFGADLGSRSELEREQIVQMKKNRSVCGLCWHKKRETN